jgi:hypothetical protein
MKSNYIMVEGSSNLARDPNTGAIVNINKDDIAKAREAKNKRKNKDREFEELKNEVSEIKELLNKLVEKL